MQKIGLFGTYSDQPQYSRTAALRKALIDLNLDIVEFRSQEYLSGDRSENFRSTANIIKAIFSLLKNWGKLTTYTRALRKQQIVLVPYPSHADVFLAKLLLLGSNTILIIDAFLGLKDTLVNDRQLIKVNSYSAKMVHIWEKAAFQISDAVIFDTDIQCDRAALEYSISVEKFFSIPVGIDEELWKPRPKKNQEKSYQVLFWGSFIPLHGIEYIVEAAKLLQDKEAQIEFLIIGKGQTEPEIEKLLNQNQLFNLTWIRSILPIEELSIHAADADCILGIFGGSEKAASVIPYKVYQALASNRVVITRESSVFDNEPVEQFGIYQIPPENPNALANMLSTLSMGDHPYSSSPRAYYEMHLSQKVIKIRMNQLIKGLSG